MNGMRDTDPTQDARHNEREATSFGEDLLAWYDANRRELPWRETTDPYAIWVSEVMLQQTQVSRVVDYWPRFLERFPTVAALAESSADDVLGLWSGLGYYRRARLLREAAREIAGSRGGSIPTSAAELRELPGMGEYTASAVASIAFAEPVPVVDANVARVLARVLAIEGDVRRGDARRAVREGAQELLDRHRPGDYNQAVMELGALVCTPVNPDCGSCPVAAMCRAAARGEPTAFPTATAAPSTVALREAAALVLSGGKVLLERGGCRGWWEGLWVLPRISLDEGDDPKTALATRLASGHGVVPETLEGPLEETYSVTNHRVTMLVFTTADHDLASADAGDSSRWFAPCELEDVGVPAPDRRVVERVFGPRAGLGSGSKGEPTRRARTRR
jgi:A/G-specific adenine glycosylase